MQITGTQELGIRTRGHRDRLTVGDKDSARRRAGPNQTPSPRSVALPAAGGGNSRETPTETTLWELTNVTLTDLKLETDNGWPTTCPGEVLPGTEDY